VFYADDINTLGGSVHSIKVSAETLTVASNGCRLEENDDKTKYMVMSRDKNAVRSHTIKIGNRSFEMVEQFKYFGSTLTNQKFIQQELKIRSKSENACYHSVQNLLFSTLLPKNLKIEIYRPIILHVVLYK
jgi:hypothetical protein